jgi:hypothetical protein
MNVFLIIGVSFDVDDEKLSSGATVIAPDVVGILPYCKYGE